MTNYLQKWTKLFCILFISIFLPSVSVFAQDLTYDRYTEDLRTGTYQKQKITLTERILSLPAYPLELTKYLADNVLNWVDKYHVEDKTIWLVKELTDKGIYLSGKASKHSGGLGGRVTVVKDDLIKLSPFVESAGFKAWTGLSSQLYNENAGQLVLKNILNTGVYANQTFLFESRPQEDFFGVGRRSSRANSFTYDYQRMLYDTKVGKEFDLIWGSLNVEAMYAFNDVKISNGQDTGKRDIQDFFIEQNLSGVNGGDYHTVGLEIVHDDRDNKGFPTRGGVRSASVYYNKGVDGADYEYMKYKFSAAQYFKVYKTDSVIGLKVGGEFNDKVANGTLPFFDMARLGGSETIRGYQYNRFFDNNALWMNMEYRYNIWKYRIFRLDMAPFLDLGSVFGEGDDFEISNSKLSYGSAFRFRVASKTFLNIEVAKSGEGTEFYFKTKTAF